MKEENFFEKNITFFKLENVGFYECWREKHEAREQHLKQRENDERDAHMERTDTDRNTWEWMR